MPTYAAFLRAINLGAVRKFPKAAIKAAVEGAGMTDVETYINTGNVRFTTPMRSRAKIEAALEKAFQADRDFEVPTFVFTPAELVEIAETRTSLGRARRAAHALRHAVQAAAGGRRGDDAARRGLPGRDLSSSTAGPPMPCSRPAPRARSCCRAGCSPNLGQGTSRNVTVMRALAQKWG